MVEKLTRNDRDSSTSFQLKNSPPGQVMSVDYFDIDTNARNVNIKPHSF